MESKGLSQQIPTKQRGGFRIRGPFRLRGAWKRRDSPCPRAGPETQNLNVKWALKSRGWRKKGKRRRKTGPQLSHDKPSFPDDVNNRGMKDKVQDVESCCKHSSEHIIF